MREMQGRGGWALAALLAGLWLGPVAQVQQAQLWPGTIYAAVLLAGLLCMAVGVRLRHAAGALAVGLGAAALAFGATGWRADAFLTRSLAPALEGRDLLLVGQVAAMPQVGELGTRFRFDVRAATLDGQPVQLPARVLLSWWGGAPAVAAGLADALPRPAPVRAGEVWQLSARLKAPHGHVNPHGFDYELWLWEQGLQATGYVRAGPRDMPPRLLAATWQRPVERLRQSVRDAILERVEDRALAGVLAALAVGDQQAIDRADWDVFRATGVAHLMSISGLHVTMFAWGAAALVGAAWRRSARACLAWPAPHAALCGGLLLAAAYAVFSGWGVPAQRTVWMLATVALLRLAGRRWPWPWVWGLAGAVVLAIDPWALLQAGFWLSFVAVGVLFATDGGMPGAAAAGWRARAVQLLREQAVVTVALAPLTLLLFGQVSLVGLVANLLAIPWVTLVVTPLALAGALVPPLWEAGALAVSGLAAVLRLLASLPGAVLQVAAPPLWAGAAGLAGGLLLALRLPVAWRALGVPLLLPVLLWQPHRPPAGEVELLAADVGQGNAVLVRTARHTLVYDTGPRYSAESDAGQRVVVPLLRALGERVDTVVVSHRDSDHSGGAAAVLAMQPGASLVSSLESAHPLAALRPPVRCEAGQRWVWDGVVFEFLHPAAADYGTPARPNALSCVLRVAGAGGVALLAGDIEQAQEQRLVQGGAPLAADLLLVPHHGSRTSSSLPFLQAVQPQLALVQAGWRNRFGHPAAPVVARYQALGIPLVGSAACGAAHWTSAQPRVLRCEREQVRRYWHHRAVQAD